MIIVIEPDARGRHEEVVSEVLRQRHEHFVIRRGWSLPCQNGTDVDRYDAADAVYIVNLEPDGAVTGSVRLNEAARSSLLADLFPFLVESSDNLRGHTTFEGSRLIVDPRPRSRAASCRIKADLLIAVVERCLDRGGTRFQAVIDVGMLSGFVEMSLQTRVLGLAHDYGGGPRVRGGGRCVAFSWDLSSTLLSDLRDFRAEFSTSPEPSSSLHYAN